MCEFMLISYLARMTRGSNRCISCVLTLLLLSCASCVNAGLGYDYYYQSCRNAEYIVWQTMQNATWSNPRTPASITRMHFHDCFVEGCDGSVLLNSTQGNVAEKDAPPNNPSLVGFEVVDAAKAAVERVCPGVVSCADILAFMARDGVFLAGGPFYYVRGGRKDGRVSKASRANQFLPPPTFNITQLKAAFAAKNLTSGELVTLSGAHTIGLSHCSSFKNRLYNFTGQGDQDPSLNTTYANSLKAQCPRSSSTDPTVPMDSTSQVFDGVYYSGIRQGKGLFTSDEQLLHDSVTYSDVIQYSQNTNTFFQKFADAMIKMGEIEVKTGSDGEIRHNCRYVN